MNEHDGNRNELRRLQRAIAALATDLDAIKQRPPFPLKNALLSPREIENFVDHYAIALERSRSGLD
jgi:hypothetical protein